MITSAWHEVHFISFSVKCEETWHRCLILFNFNSYVWGGDNTPTCTLFNSYGQFYCYLLHKHEVHAAVEPNALCSCCLYLHILKKAKYQETQPKAPNKTLDLVLCVQIQAEIFQCVKDTVRPWQAAVCCIVWFLPPSLPQY